MKRFLLLISLTMIGTGAFAQIESPVKWAYGAKRISATEAVVFLKATIDDGWHIYSQDVKDGGPTKTVFTFPASKEYVLEGATAEPAPLTKYETAFKMQVGYFERSVIFQQKIKLRTSGPVVVKGSLEYGVCNARKCLPPDDVDFSIPVGK